MENSIVSVGKNQEWLTSQEAAAILGISRSAFHRLLKTHNAKLVPYLQFVKGRGGKAGEQTLISRDGLFLLAASKDSRGRNKYSKALVNDASTNISQQLAEKAIKDSKASPMDNLIGNLKGVIENMQRDIAALKAKQPEPQLVSAFDLFALPAPTKEVPEASLRAKTNRLIRDFADRKHVEYSLVYSRFYSEFYDRYHVNVSAKARHAGKKTLDYIDQNGYMEDFYNMVLKLLK